MHPRRCPLAQASCKSIAKVHTQETVPDCVFRGCCPSSVPAPSVALQDPSKRVHLDRLRGEVFPMRDVNGPRQKWEPLVGWCNRERKPHQGLPIFASKPKEHPNGTSPDPAANAPDPGLAFRPFSCCMLVLLGKKQLRTTYFELCSGGSYLRVVC